MLVVSSEVEIRKKIKIYKENNEFIIEHIEKRRYKTEEELKKELQSFKPVDDYNIFPSRDVWTLVINQFADIR